MDYINYGAVDYMLKVSEKMVHYYSNLNENHSSELEYWENSLKHYKQIIAENLQQDKGGLK